MARARQGIEYRRSALLVGPGGKLARGLVVGDVGMLGRARLLSQIDGSAVEINMLVAA